MWQIAIALAQAGELPPDMIAAEGMSGGALAFMLVSMGAVVTLTAWCFSRVLRTKEHFDPDGTGPAPPPVPGEEESGVGV